MFYQSIVETFHRMGYSIVSEGVETEEEMSLLSSWGVDMIQGYYFSRPLPVDELLKLLNMCVFPFPHTYAGLQGYGSH